MRLNILLAAAAAAVIAATPAVAQQRTASGTPVQDAYMILTRVAHQIFLGCPDAANYVIALGRTNVNVEPTPKLRAAGETASSVPLLVPAMSVSVPPLGLINPVALFVIVGATLEVPEVRKLPLLTMLVPPPLCRNEELSVVVIVAPLWLLIEPLPKSVS